MNEFLGLFHKAVVLSEPTSWGCLEHTVRYTHRGLISGLDTEEHRGAGWRDSGHDPGPWRARKAVYSPSKRVSWTSGLSSVVRTWLAGKINSLSLDCAPGRPKYTQHPLNMGRLL